MQVSGCKQSERMMKMFWNEMKAILKNKTVMVGLIVALVIPTLYSGTFLWAFWDPYEYTDNLQVAVVNDDQAVTFQGEELFLGEEMTKMLEDNKDFEWHFVDKQKAMAGLEDNTYSMMIELPSDLSEKVSTIFTEEAEQPVIYSVPNQAKNYMISMIQNGMVQEMKTEVSNTITETYMQALVDTVTESETGMEEIKSNMDEMVEGLESTKETVMTGVDVNPAISGDEKAKLQESFDKLVAGSTEISSSIGDQLASAEGVALEAKNVKLATHPIELTEKPYTEVPNYGNGFVPFTLSLGLFIGAMVVTVVFPAIEPFTKHNGILSWFGSKFAVIALIGILQAIIADVILLYVLGVTVESVGLFFLFTVVVSLTFVTLLHCLSVVFKEASRVLVVMLIILQITGSGGTFPTEMVPTVLQNISKFLPMTYAVAGFRTLVGNDHYGLMWENIGYLSVFFVVALLGSLTYFSFTHRKRKQRRLADVS